MLKPYVFLGVHPTGNLHRLSQPKPFVVLTSKAAEDCEGIHISTEIATRLGDASLGLEVYAHPMTDPAETSDADDVNLAFTTSNLNNVILLRPEARQRLRLECSSRTTGKPEPSKGAALTH